MTSRTGFADEKDSVLGELAVRMKKLSTDGYKQRRGEILKMIPNPKLYVVLLSFPP